MFTPNKTVNWLKVTYKSDVNWYIVTRIPTF